MEFIEYIVDEGKADPSEPAYTSFEYKLLEAACSSLSKGKIIDELMPKVLILLASLNHPVTNDALKHIMQNDDGKIRISLDKFLVSVFLNENEQLGSIFARVETANKIAWIRKFSKKVSLAAKAISHAMFSIN